MLANLLAGIILVGIMWNVIPHKLLLLWLASLITISSLTLIFFQYLRPFYRSLETVPDKLYYYQLPFLFGSIWGVAGYIFFIPDLMTNTAFLIIFLFGMVSGGVSALSSLWLSYLALAIPVLLPFTIRLIMTGQTQMMLLASVTMSYLLVMILISKLSYDSVSKSLQIRHENRGLIDDLKKQKQKAEKSSKDKSRFLASASHDLRQPIHTLSLLSSAISPEIHSNRGRKILQQIDNANEVMLDLLNSLLDISKLDAGTIKPKFAVTNIKHTIDALVDEFQGMAEENELELRSRICPYRVKTDLILLSTILRNLIQNALFYTEKGKVLISCRKKNNKILLQVWDTGKGIAHEHQDIVFAEFQQLSNPERDQNKGLGLGLAICKRLSDLLNVELTLKSVVGKGSVFTLVIPCLIESEQKDYLDQNLKREKFDNHDTKMGTSLGAMLNFEEMVVLVIDDNDAVLEATKVLLEKWGCIVLTASSIEETATLAKNHTGKIKIIIADYRLREETTGVEAINAFAKNVNYSTSNILITGDTSPERMQEISSHGLPVLHKPIKEPQLKVVIGRLLRMSA